MEYKLKEKSIGILILHLVEILLIIGIVYSVVKYFTSLSPIEPSEIHYFIFVGVLVIMIICKCSDLVKGSLNGIIDLFEKKDGGK